MSPRNIKNLPPLCLLVGFSLLSLVGNAQIRSNWFNINPTSSDLDATNPNGASGGRVHNLGATANMTRVYGASEWGGLWQSFNSGVTWAKVRTFIPSAAYDVKVAAATTSSAQGTVYVTSFFDGRTTTPFSGVAFSRNAGTTWQKVPLPPGPCVAPNLTGEPSGWTISIRPNNQAQVFAGTNCGLARTIDGGTNWTYLDPSPGDGVFEPVYAVLAHSNAMVDVITQNGFFFSRNNGTSWRAGVGVAGGLGDLAVSPFENHVLYASSGGQLLESNDSGKTWPTAITVPTGSGRVPFVATNRRSTANTYDLWYGGVGLFRATCLAKNPPIIGGGGNRAPLNTWSTDFSTPRGAHNDFGDILFNPAVTSDACPLLVCCDGGIYRNTLTATGANCQTPAWDQPTITPYATWLYGFEGMVGNNNRNQIYYGLQDNGVWGTISAPTGPTNVFPVWTNDQCCDGVTTAADPGEALYVLGFFSPGRAFRVFKGAEGIPSANEIPNYPASGSTVMSFASGRTMVRTGSNAFAFTFSDGVYTTPNINANTIAWTYLSNPTGTSTTGGGIKAAPIAGTTNIFYKTGVGKPYSTGQIFRYPGTASGSAWTQINRPPGMSSFTIYDVDPNNGSRMMACAINAANVFSTWATTNGGTSWTALAALDNLMTATGTYKNSSLQGPREFYPNFGRVWQPYMFEINPNDGNIAVAGAADAGIFLTTNFGGNWTLLTNPTNPTSTGSTAPHVPRPLFAWFSTKRIANSTSAFDLWVGTQGAGVQKFLIETP